MSKKRASELHYILSPSPFVLDKREQYGRMADKELDPDMTWSVKEINTFIHHPLIHSLMTYDTQYNNRDIQYIEHNYSSEDSSL